MISFPARTRTGTDGSLRLSIPTGLVDTEVDVLVVVETAGQSPRSTGPRDEWPETFFETYAGALVDLSFERPAQGGYEDREPMW